MDQIRFNQPMRPSGPEKSPYERDLPPVSQGVGRKALKSLLIVLIIAAVVVLGFLAKDRIFKNGENPEPGASPYSAVFLSNGQVYFGKLLSKNKSEFVLSNVYYLQLSQDGAQTTDPNDPKFSLIKLGKEIHGPTDRLYINASQVLFYESLREDSTVVQSIKTQK